MTPEGRGKAYELNLPIKEPWFSMVKNGEKPEEYRERKPYWTVRLEKLFPGCGKAAHDKNRTARIRFTNGYRNERPWFEAECSLEIRTGNPEWGAVPGTVYYVLVIRERKAPT